MLTTLKQKFRIWLFRPKIESGTVTLNQRRIFILPTRQGLGFAFVLLLMLLGDINYNLSLGYVLTFLLGNTGMVLICLSVLHEIAHPILVAVSSRQLTSKSTLVSWCRRGRGENSRQLQHRVADNPHYT